MLRKRLTHGRLCYELVELTLNKKGLRNCNPFFISYLLYATEQYYELRCEYP